MSNCPACGKENPSGRPRCSSCGAKIPPPAPNGEDSNAQPFQALGTVELKKVRHDEASAPGTAAPPGEEEKKKGRKKAKALTLPEILPLDLDGGEEAAEDDALPVHSGDDLPAPPPPLAPKPKLAPEQQSRPGEPLPAEILDQLVEYASDGALAGEGEPDEPTPATEVPIEGLRAPSPPKAPPKAPPIEDDLPAAAPVAPPKASAKRKARKAPAPAPVDLPELEAGPLDQPIAPGSANLQLDEAPDDAPLELEGDDPPPAAEPKPAAARKVPQVVLGKQPVAMSATVEPTRSADGSALVIGSPVLPPAPEMPELIRSIPTERKGLFSRVGYGLKAPKLARTQKEVVSYVSSNLSRLRKQEHDFVTALGRAARRHGLAPEASASMVTAADREEARSGGGGGGGDGDLAELERRHESMSSRVMESHKKLNQSEKRLGDLRIKEKELREPPKTRLSEAEMSARVREYETIKAQLTSAEAERNGLRQEAKTVERPFRLLEEKIARARTEGSSGGGTANPTAPPSKATLEIDSDIGRAILREGLPAPALQQLTTAVETCQTRIRDWERAQKAQQAELELFDEGRAKGGFWMLVVGAIGMLVLTVGAGEAVRQIILALE